MRTGPASNLYRTLANHPALFRAWADFAWTLRSQGRTPRALRELMILRCAHRAGSRYVWADHLRMARAAGADERRIEAIHDWVSADCYDRDERAALTLVDGAVNGETIDELSACFDAPAAVELVLSASFYVMVPRVVNALRIPQQDAVT